jgi:predicted ribosome quality control (RQC) complex YloA/Tae2 family protein
MTDLFLFFFPNSCGSSSIFAHTFNTDKDTSRPVYLMRNFGLVMVCLILRTSRLISSLGLPYPPPVSLFHPHSFRLPLSSPSSLRYMTIREYSQHRQYLLHLFQQHRHQSQKIERKILLTDLKSCENHKEHFPNYDENYLQIQIQRQVDRVIKKIGKISENEPQTKQIDDESNPSKMAILQERFHLLQSFQDALKNSSQPLSQSTLQQIIEFGLLLTPPSKSLPNPLSSSNSRTNKKQKVDPRKPYKLFTSFDHLQIFVGRSAADNDILSLSSQYCDPQDWWLHVSGLPGSHVVLKSRDDDVQRKYPQSIYEAAVLAVHFSKSSSSSHEVTLTRGRHISKNRNDPPGRVMLQKVIEILRVHSSSKKYQTTLQRLLEQQQQ